MTTPITCTLQGKSVTNIVTPSFNDGVISFTGFSVNDRFPIVQTCKTILQLVGKAAQPYPLDVYRGSTKLFRIRSVIWGTRMTVAEDIPDYEYYDKQLITIPPV